MQKLANRMDKEYLPSPPFLTKVTLRVVIVYSGLEFIKLLVLKKCHYIS